MPSNQQRPIRRIPKLTAREAAKMCVPFDQLRIDAHAFVSIDDAIDIGPRAYARDIVDNSMVANPPHGRDNFEPTDTVIFDPDRTPGPGDYVDVLLDGRNETMFRKFRPLGAHQGGAYELVPLNTNYPTELVTADKPAKSIALAVRHIRRLAGNDAPRP